MLSILIAVLAGLLIGFGVAAGMHLLKVHYMETHAEPTSLDPTIEADAPYDYAIPMNVIYTRSEPYAYEDIDERRRSDNYVEIIDTGYASVL